jgi:antitoxin HicB
MAVMRYSVILVPDDDGRLSAMVPALPGCVSQGDTRADALDHIREAATGWLETEAAQGRSAPVETPAVVTAGVAQAIEIIDEMQAAGEYAADRGYELEVTTVEVQPPVPV